MKRSLDIADHINEIENESIVRRLQAYVPFLIILTDSPRFNTQPPTEDGRGYPEAIIEDTGNLESSWLNIADEPYNGITYDDGLRYNQHFQNVYIWL